MRFVVSMSAKLNAEVPFDFVRHPYIPFLQRFGIVPILVPNLIQDPREFALAVGAEGVVLSGGGDVDPARYEEKNTYSDLLVAQRDQAEVALLELAVEKRLPVFAICRGIQMLNVYFGGSLVQDIPAEIGRAVEHDESQHPICITDGRFMDLLGGRDLAVNSYHHQGITAERLARGFDVFALSEPDGIIEGIVHREYPIMGVQWHPERGGPSAAADQTLVRHFLQGGFWK
ncbi:MAG TPA: type 1 glutamine amidotransferase [Aggregatilineaceae bacterium]|nr:type 1 glutamine amidotransferase [Aggregatilineaceae bacterium]